MARRRCWAQWYHCCDSVVKLYSLAGLGYRCDNISVEPGGVGWGGGRYWMCTFSAAYLPPLGSFLL